MMKTLVFPQENSKSIPPNLSLTGGWGGGGSGLYAQFVQSWNMSYRVPLFYKSIQTCESGLKAFHESSYIRPRSQKMYLHVL